MSYKDGYKAGFLAGLKAYAWWKDGVEYVGTTGTTLKQAVAGVEKTWNYDSSETAAPQDASQGRQETMERETQASTRPSPAVAASPIEDIARRCVEAIRHCGVKADVPVPEVVLGAMCHEIRNILYNAYLDYGWPLTERPKDFDGVLLSDEFGIEPDKDAHEKRS